MKKKVLVTGASGYVGGRLVKALEEKAERVSCLARNPEFIEKRFKVETEIYKGDVLNKESLYAALAGVDTAYYLIHSMGSEGTFEQEDRLAARNFAEVAREQGVRRVIYLGGLGADTNLSPHLRSRQEVGRILKEYGPQTIEFRTSIIIGSGSLSFEMIRSLVNKLPVMITPKWVFTEAQPIGIESVISYLLEALELEFEESRVFEVGGPDRLSYADLMKEYARQVGVKRIFFRVPVLTPKLSSLWLGLVTPVYARVGRKMIDSLRFKTIVEDDSALKYFSVRPLSLSKSMKRAFLNEDRECMQTRWTDAVSSSGYKTFWGGVRFGSRIVEIQQVESRLNAAELFRPIREIGGKRGWYYADFIWKVRGWVDLLIGGVGLRRGRRDADQLIKGDVLDFWRVEAIEKDKLLRLSAEMKVPGRAWLQFEVEDRGEVRVLTQTAIFDPLGLGGLLYWYLLYPVHLLIFRGMFKAIVKIAES